MSILSKNIKKIGREVLFLHVKDQVPRMGEGSFIRLRDGSIMYAFISYVGGNWADECPADIAAVVSCDEGESWSEPRTLLWHDAQSRNLMCPTLLRLPNGDIGMVLIRKQGYSCIPHFSVSKDEGRTFSTPVPCIDSERYYVVENDHAIMLRNGRILVPMNRHERLKERFCSYGTMCMLASDDMGQSWQMLSDHVTSPYPKEITRTGLQETAVYEQTDGSIRAISRTDLGCQWECRSEDGGVTWSDPVPNRFFSGPDAPLLIKDVGPYTVAVFCPMPNFTTRVDDRTWGRTPIVCAVSEDKGKSFPRVFYLEDDLSNGYAYPAIFDGGEYMLVAYYHSDDLDGVLRSTRMLKIDLSELAGKNA